MAVAPATICKVGKIASAQQSILEYLEQKKNTRTHIRSQQKKHHTQNCPLCALNIGLFRRSGYDGEFRLHVIGETDPSNAWGGWRRLDIFFSEGCCWDVCGKCTHAMRACACVLDRRSTTGVRAHACVSECGSCAFSDGLPSGTRGNARGKTQQASSFASAHTDMRILAACVQVSQCLFPYILFVFLAIHIRMHIYILPSFPRRSSAHNTRTHNAIHTPSTMVNGLDIGDFNSFWLLVVHFVCERLN